MTYLASVTRSCDTSGHVPCRSVYQTNPKQPSEAPMNHIIIQTLYTKLIKTSTPIRGTNSKRCIPHAHSWYCLHIGMDNALWVHIGMANALGVGLHIQTPCHPFISKPQRANIILCLGEKWSFFLVMETKTRNIFH